MNQRGKKKRTKTSSPFICAYLGLKKKIRKINIERQARDERRERKEKRSWRSP